MSPADANREAAVKVTAASLLYIACLAGGSAALVQRNVVALVRAQVNLPRAGDLLV